VNVTEFATRPDLILLRAELRADLAELKVELMCWTTGLFVAQTAMFSAIVGLFKIFS
jgi:hypothetical protein